MKITIIRHSILNRGGDRVILDYCDYLVQQGHEIIYWTNEINTVFPINPKIRISKIPFKGKLGTIFFTIFSKFYSDVIVVDLIVMALFVSLRNKIHVLYLAQDYDVEYYKSFLLRYFIDNVYKLVLTQKRVMVISESEGLTKTLQKYITEHLLTIPNGVDLTNFYRDSQSPLLLKRQKPFVILLFTREDHRKGLDVAIKSIEALLKFRDSLSWELWTIGSVNLQLQGASVRNFGFMGSDKSLREILSAADIYLVPSRSEGLSLLLLQAMACACAIVTTRASSIIEHEVNGLVSPIEDHMSLATNMHRLMQDEKLLSKLKINARLSAENYSSEKSCKRFEEALSAYGQKMD